MKAFFGILTLVVVAYGQECKPDEFTCADGDCIPDTWICDTWDDCAGGEDEMDCPCEYECPDGTCIPETWVCDGWNDCGDNSDERDCPCESEDEIKCPTTGECIRQDYWCDVEGICDCNNCEDEKNCTKISHHKTHNNIQLTRLEKENLRLRRNLGKIHRNMHKRQKS